MSGSLNVCRETEAGKNLVSRVHITLAATNQRTPEVTRKASPGGPEASL